MKYQVNVKGVKPALAKKLSAILSREVNRTENEVAKYNRSVAAMRNQATVRQAVDEFMRGRK